MRSSRRWRASALESPLPLAAALALPVGADTTFPAGVPLCLRRRFRFVWAIGQSQSSQHPFDQVPLGVEAPQRHVLGEALEGRLRSQARPARPRPPAPARGPPRPPRAAACGGGPRRWSTPAPARARAGTGRARGPPAGRRRTRAGSAAMRCASSRSSLSRSTLKATSGGRAAARIDAGAWGAPACGPKSGTTSPLSAAAPGPPSRPPAGRRALGARAGWPARRRAPPAPRAPRRSGSPR